MNIVQITAGAGGMYCGICLRDNALVAQLRKMGHDVLMIPLYLPLTLDEKDDWATRLKELVPEERPEPMRKAG